MIFLVELFINRGEYTMHPTKKTIRDSFNWKATYVTILFALVFIILVLPSLVVLPSTFNQEVQISDEEEFSSEFKDNWNDNALVVHVLRDKSDQVETIPLEEYVIGVVSAEMPADFELEALKAQALAARTYIIQYMMATGADQEDAITDTVQHQVYYSDQELQQNWGADYQWKKANITRAVAETSGEILTYQNKPITPAFFSTSNGYTENAEDYWENELPYLKSVASPWDEASPRYLDQKTISIPEVEALLDINWDHLAETIPITKTDSNRIKTIKLGGESFTGRQIREKLELRSSDFELEKKDNHLIFTTKGYGHGIGMSQYGANGMAQEGKDYKTILHYYYQGVEVDTVSEAIPALHVQK